MTLKVIGYLVQDLIEKEKEEFDQTFTQEWWNGFGTTSDINQQGVEAIKEFLEQSITRVVTATINDVISNIPLTK